MENLFTEFKSEIIKRAKENDAFTNNLKGH